MSLPRRSSAAALAALRRALLFAWWSPARAARAALAQPAVTRAVLGAVALLTALGLAAAETPAREPGSPAARDAARAESPAPEAPAVARRVVSLNPSLTAIAVALGARDALVGVDSFSLQALPEVAGLPAVGGLYNPSIEAVVALEPDLVAFVPAAEQRDFQRTLEQLGLPVLPLGPVTFEEVLAAIETFGARLGRAREARVRVDAIRAARAAAEARAASRPRPRTVLVLQRDPLFVVGRGSFVDEMLASAGAENAAHEFAEPYPRVAREWLLAAAPELLLDASGESEPAERYWARWASLPAVRAGRVVALAPGAVTLPGPWLDRALAALADAVQGAPDGTEPSPSAPGAPSPAPAPPASPDGAP
ncbi:MAG TPA: helical backbone metal receptor [Myxococcota bacterium]|nr:helical backbone metal receptor [Myxococcota bacterium]